MQVFKRDNNLAVELPKTLVDELRLKEGDQVSLVPAGKGLLAVETREDRRARFLRDMEQFRWPVPEGYKFDRDEANER